MDRNRYIYINSHKCEPYLSNFGKQVLQILVQQYAERNVQNDRISQERYQSRRMGPKILNFIDESSIKSNIATPPSPPVTIQNNRKNILNSNDDILDIPLSTELVKTFQSFEITSDNIQCASNSIENNALSELPYKEPNDELQKLAYNSVPEDIVGEYSLCNVGWDNMFDSELFGVVPIEQLVTNYENENAINKVIFKDNSTSTIKEATSTEEYNNKKDIVKRGTVKKAKIVCNHSPKRFLRRQKYSKSVKNWLYTVDIPKGLDTNDTNETTNIIKKHKIEHNIKKRIDSKKVDDTNRNIGDVNLKTAKKTVQAQLANKNGVMKFSKPKTQLDVTHVEDDKMCIFKKKNEKVTKKFVPPVKYPVKNITYEIITVDDKTIDEHFSLDVNAIDNVIAMLIYRNGYCQLNSDFSDGSCTTDGILLSTGDKFVYFMAAGENIRKTLVGITQNCTLITYDARSILVYLSSHLQMDVSRINTYDIKIGASLLDPDHPPQNFIELQKNMSFTPQFTTATECSLQKCAWYMTLLNECWLKLKQILVENQLWQVFVEVEMKLLPIIAKMECRGISIDMVKLKSMEEALLARMKVVEQECYKAAGKVFQINSTLQVRGILYDELKLDTVSNVKIAETLAKGVKSTSESMLRSLISVHPLPKLILEYRHLHKAHATFLAGIAQHVNDEIVKPVWDQTAAATGRIASNNPNLQAIPKVPFSLVMFPDDDNNEPPQVNFRSVYVPRAGCALLAADFRHVECRVFAHFAGDEALRAALAAADLFRALAARWLNKSDECVSEAERERTKRLVYASLYGAGVRKLMDILDVSYEQALQITASFNRTFPTLKSFARQVVSRCCSSGSRLSTILGRLRHFTDIASEDFSLRSHAERQAVNFVVQGSAADLCKTAMILTDREFRNSTPPVEAYLLLQIHDELIWEVRESHVQMAADIIKRVMESCGQECGMSVSLPVTISVGNNWADMEQYHCQ